MSEEKKAPRTIRKTLDRKFGISESRERRPRREESSREGTPREGRSGDRRFDRDRKPFDRERRPFDRERRPFDRDRKPFDRERRGSEGGRRRFGDKPFGRGVSSPIYRQRPEPKAEIGTDDTLEESVLESRVAQAEVQESGANPPWFKKLLALTTEKGREREGCFLGEGVHVVNELVQHHREIIISIYAVEGFSDQGLLDAIKDAKITLHELPADQMKQISSTVTPQGIIAQCRIANTKPVYESSRSVLTLVDAVQDPGNLGTLFRTSLGFGSSGMILGRGTVSPFNPKVVRGSSGTFLRVPFEFDLDLVEQINFLRSKGYTIIATDLHAKQSLREIPARKLRKMAFLVGNEGAGTNPYFIELADETVKIPMSSELESLNVAVAHGILSYEAAQIQEELK